jgi:hypothetical protein
MTDDAPPKETFAPRRRVATGPERPQFLEPGDVDQVMMALLAVMSELSAVRDRLDTHERLAAQGIVASPEAVEQYRASQPVEDARTQGRTALIHRVLRSIRSEALMLKD